MEVGVIERAGDATPRRVDVRVLASTSRSLDTEVREGRFRDDLLRRLRVVRIRVPPLRERRGDVVLLTEHLLARHGAARVRLTPSANGVLVAGEWPGNVRQLERVVRHLAAGVASGADALIEPQHLPETMLGGAAPAAADPARNRRPPHHVAARAVFARREPHGRGAGARYRPGDVLPLVERRGIGRTGRAGPLSRIRDR